MCLSIYLSICLSVYLCICLSSTYLSIYLSTNISITHWTLEGAHPSVKASREAHPSAVWGGHKPSEVDRISILAVEISAWQASHRSANKR